MDRHTEYSSQGWLSRLGSSIKGVLLGLLLCVAACPIHFFNEGRAVETAEALAEGAAVVVAVDASRLDPAHEGALVHLSGQSEADGPVIDRAFGVSGDGIRLDRAVEMFQWVETSTTTERKRAGGKVDKETTWTYDRQWAPTVASSSSFHVPEGHQNPGSLPFGSESFAARRVTVGGFQLGPGLVRQIRGGEPVVPDKSVLGALDPELIKRTRIHDGGLYVGKNPQDPKVGDVRVHWELTPPSLVSVIAQQTGTGLGPYTTENGRSLQLLSMGAVSAEAMFAQGERDNAMLTWLLRGVGFLALFIGLGLIFKPLVVVADVVPLIGNLVGMGTGLASFFVAAPVTLALIAISWIAHRPVLGVALLVGAALLVAGGVKLSRQRAA
jgi:hypothetical protein